MTTTAVFLHGDLGEKYGKRFDLEVASVAEAIALLKTNFREFAKDVIGHGNKYTVWAGKTNLSKDELKCPVRGRDIHIVPHIAGAGGDTNILQIIIGVILVVVGVFTTIFGDYSGSVIQLGIGLIVGGVAGMIFSPSIRKFTPNHVDPSATLPSYAFNGAVNTVGQGNPVPILYGRMMVGSQVVSGGITAKDAA